MKLKDYPRSSLTLFAGLALAAGAFILFWWLAEEVFEGDARHFDELVRAAVNGRSTPAMTAAMRGFKGNDRFVEIPVLLFQLRKRLPQLSVVLSVH